MVLRELRSLRPEMPVVIMSGLSEAEAANHLVGLGKTAFLHKPFRKDDLFLVLRLVLGGGS
jgi:DNA-binding NarL/FixJ family response regulator